MNLLFRKEVVSLALPVLVEHFSSSFLLLMDTFFVSKLGPRAIASVGLGTYMFWITITLAQVSVIGTTVLVSQTFGSGKTREVRKIVFESLLLSLLLSLPLLIASRAGIEFYLRAIGAPSELWSDTESYLAPLLMSIPGLYMSASLSASLRGIGDTRTPMKIGLGANALNLVLDPLLIYGFGPFNGLGVFGAGLASALSTYWSFLVYLIVIPSRIGIEPILPRKETFLKLLDLGIPAGVERIAMSVSYSAYVSLIARFGSECLAAYQVGLKIESFAYMPGLAFSIVSSVLVGQSIGSKNMKRAVEMAWESSKASTIAMSLSGLVLALTAPITPKPFLKDESLLFLATVYLVIAGLSEPGLGFSMGMSGAMRGSGDTRLPVVLNLISFWSVRIGVGYLLGYVLGFGVFGVWACMAIEVSFRGLLFFLAFRKLFNRRVRILV